MGNSRAVVMKTYRGYDARATSVPGQRARWRFKFRTDDEDKTLLACCLDRAAHENAPVTLSLELAYIDAATFARLRDVPGSHESEREEFWFELIAKFYNFSQIDYPLAERTVEQDRLLDWVAARVPMTALVVERRRRWRTRAVRGEFDKSAK
jgi:hypothetical protein